VVYEAFYVDGRLIKTGRLLAAEFINQGNSHQAIYFKNPQGRDGYYTAQGQSMKRAFLKSPMPFDRISSGFSSGRPAPGAADLARPQRRRLRRTDRHPGSRHCRCQSQLRRQTGRLMAI
jgi:hypothetical protein